MIVVFFVVFVSFVGFISCRFDFLNVIGCLVRRWFGGSFNKFCVFNCWGLMVNGVVVFGYWGFCLIFFFWIKVVIGGCEGLLFLYFCFSKLRVLEFLLFLYLFFFFWGLFFFLFDDVCLFWRLYFLVLFCWL